MILCCKSCGNHFSTSTMGLPCSYCGGSTEMLISSEDISLYSSDDLESIIKTLKEKYTLPDNPNYNKDLWESREFKHTTELTNETNAEIEKRTLNHMLTTGYNFEGYTITEYKGVVSGEVVIGTGFISEFTANFSDLFGLHSEQFASKMEKVKKTAISRLIAKSVLLNGNAIIGIDFDYITFESNMIGISVNGTSVKIEKI